MRQKVSPVQMLAYPMNKTEGLCPLGACQYITGMKSNVEKTISTTEGLWIKYPTDNTTQQNGMEDLEFQQKLPHCI